MSKTCGLKERQSQPRMRAPKTSNMLLGTSFQFRRAIIGGGLPQPSSLKKAQKGHARTYHDRVSFISVMVVLALNICFFPQPRKKDLPIPFHKTPLASVVLLASVVPLPRFPAASVAASGRPGLGPVVHGRTPGSSRRPRRQRPPP